MLVLSCALRAAVSVFSFFYACAALCVVTLVPAPCAPTRPNPKGMSSHTPTLLPTSERLMQWIPRTTLSTAPVIPFVVTCCALCQAPAEDFTTERVQSPWTYFGHNTRPL